LLKSVQFPVHTMSDASTQSAQEEFLVTQYQRGAGCGKTYESISWLHDSNFDHFFYVTKQHTAKEVIYKELMNQVKPGGVLQGIVCSDPEIIKENRAYIVNLKREDRPDCVVFILVVDALNVALRRLDTVPAGGSDRFQALANAIATRGADQVDDEGNLRLKRQRTNLSPRAMLVVDEAQDLPVCYAECFHRVSREYGVAVRLMGDKLQSIWGEPNVFTHFRNVPDVNYPLASNTVRRFQRKDHLHFVNSVVPFEELQLPPVQLHTTSDHVGDFKVIEAPMSVDSNQKDSEQQTTAFIRILMDKVRWERRDSGSWRPPEHFMFIFPCLKRNDLALRLEIALQLHWEKAFSDEQDYRENLARAEDNYWRDHLDCGNRYAVLHHAESRGPTDFGFSERAARILSIHASKGSGREVVFVVNCTQKNLEMFSGRLGRQHPRQRNLQYESLLHVAVTRMKESLYFCLLSDQQDDVACRVRRAQGRGGLGEDEITDVSSLADVKAELSSQVIVRFLQQEFGKEQSTVAALLDARNVLAEVNTKTAATGVPLVDWGEHVLRKACMYYRALAKAPGTYKSCSQVLMIRRKLRQEREFCTVSDGGEAAYFRKVNDFRNAKDGEVTEWPILKLRSCGSASRFEDASDHIKNYVLIVQGKLKGNAGGENESLPDLCPLETCVFFHMYWLCENSRSVDIGPIAMHQLFSAFRNSATAADLKCLECQAYFSRNASQHGVQRDEFSDALCKHHEFVTALDSCLGAYYAAGSGTPAGSRTPAGYNVEQVLKCWKTHGDMNPDKDEIHIKHQYSPIVGFGDHVRPLIVRPSLSAMNSCEVYAEAASAAFVAHFSYNTNHPDRYRAKDVDVAVVALNLPEPYYFHFSSKQLTDLRPHVALLVKEHFEQQHDIFLKVLNLCFRRNATAMYNELGRRNYALPPYLKQFLKDKGKDRRNSGAFQSASHEEDVKSLMQGQNGLEGLEGVIYDFFPFPSDIDGGLNYQMPREDE
jgi:hypothetical protein